MLQFLVGYLLGSAEGAPSRSLTDFELIGLVAGVLLIVLVGVPAMVRFFRRGL